MRKKALKKALDEANLCIDRMTVRADLMDKEIEELYVQQDDADGLIAELNSEIERLQEENALLQKVNIEFAVQQIKQNELFGKAFAQVQPETGPNRPNRKKLTSQEVKDIRAAYRGGATQKDLAYNYDVNPSTISRTVRGVCH